MEGGFGVKLKISISSTLTAITKVLDVDFPTMEKMLAESTAHDSTDGWTEYTDTGKRRMGEMKAVIGWDSDDATHAAVLTAFASTTPVSMSIEPPSGDEVIAFSAHIAKLGRIAKQDDVYKCEVTIQPTGKPTIS